MDAIDLHSHFWPRGMLKLAGSQESWYGWRSHPNSTGGSSPGLGQRVMPFSMPDVDLDDAEGRMKFRQENDRVVAEAMSPVGFLWADHLDAEDAAAMCREMNDELAEANTAFPDRLYGLATLPLRYERETQAELDRVAASGRIAGISLPTNVGGRNLDDPDLAPMLTAVADSGLPIVVHPTYVEVIGDDRLPRHYFRNSFGAPLESGLALMSMIYDGAFDRYPELQICFTLGGGFATMAAGRFDHRYHQGAQFQGAIATPPSTYLTRPYYDCLVYDPVGLRSLRDRVGAEKILLGTDFPFKGAPTGGMANWIDSLDFLDQTEKADILQNNAARFLGVPVPEVGK